MPLTINTNMAASRAAFYLSKNNDNLQNSLNRLSSGKQITKSYDDAGGLAVSMKLEGSIDRLKGASNNVSNAISFLQVQDGLLESAANIVSRMGELKGLYADVLKSSSDQDTYDSEFADLQSQLYDLATTKFNGVAVFGDLNDANGNAGTSNANSKVFGTNNSDALNSLEVYISEDGSSGSSVAVHQTLLLSALTLNTASNNANATWAETNTNVGDGLGVKSGTYTIAVATPAKAMSLDDLDSDFLTSALENLATARANNGGQVSRLQFSQENIQSQVTNLQSAVGRIVDVDIATETANLAKQQILVQASASMVAQANTANNVALMLLS